VSVQNPADLARLLGTLPHRPPFRFVSSLDALEPGKSTRGVWHILGDEDFFRGHFPDAPLVPGVLIAEALAQVSGLAWLSGTKEAIGMPARLAQVNVKILTGITPPASITLESTLAKEMGSLAMFDVRASIAQETGQMTIATGLIVLTKAMPDEGEFHGGTPKHQLKPG